MWQKKTERCQLQLIVSSVLLKSDLKKNIEALFAKIDTNQDNKLSKDEIKAIMVKNFEKVGVELTEEKLDRMVKS